MFRNFKFFYFSAANMHKNKTTKCLNGQPKEIIYKELSNDPSLIGCLTLREQTDDVCIMAINNVDDKRKKKCYYEKIWEGLKNRSDIVCLAYARKYHHLPNDFFDGKGRDFSINLVTMNSNYFFLVPNFMRYDEKIVRAAIEDNPSILFCIESPEDWMIQLFIDIDPMPIRSFLRNPKEIPFSLSMNNLSRKMKQVNLESFDDLILSLPIHRLIMIDFMFSRICKKIIIKHPFLEYRWSGKCFNLHVRQ